MAKLNQTINPIVLQNLEWPLLLKKLASFAQTDAGRERCLELSTHRSVDYIEVHWQQISELRNLIRSGYKPPIGVLPRMEELLRSASIGQILTGESLRTIYQLLDTVNAVHRFTSDFRNRCKPLERFHRAIFPLPKLSQDIEKAISPNGEINDDATQELKRIRQAKVALRKKIESEIRQLLAKSEIEAYLQDKFFTIRADRYVVPIRVDGRGRVKGSIYDTSDSGQTLFIEPTAIAPLNEELLELELSEKLEILRIFRELSSHVAEEHEILLRNYEGLIELDVHTAEACLAHDINAVSVKISKTPRINLLAARHPLVKTPAGEQAVANDVLLTNEQSVLIVSGPNAGGKTVVLKTAGILNLMAKAGLLLPCSPDSEVFLFHNIFVSMGDTQSLTASLSTFSGHIVSLKPILNQATERDLVLLDELAVGTEPQTGCAIAQAILESLAERRAFTIVTTHFDGLKALAVVDVRFRNGSMEFSSKALKPTYNLILDVPGQSYGIEVAEHIGLPEKVIARAKQLRSEAGSNLDVLVNSLMKAREDAKKEIKKLTDGRLAMEAQKAHWEKERKALEEARQTASEKVREKYEQVIEDLKEQFYSTVEELKQELKKAKKEGPAAFDTLAGEFQEQKKKGSEQLLDLQQNLNRLESSYEFKEPIPGSPCTIEDLKQGSPVYILSLGKKGVVTNISNQTVEVQAGLLKIRPSVEELRLLPEESPPPGKKVSKPGKKPKGDSVPFTIPTTRNSLDVRGKDADSALQETWAFIDRAVLRGDTHIIIVHGHGTDRLKKVLRTELVNSPYPLNFRPGGPEEGGDGVTVIELES